MLTYLLISTAQAACPATSADIVEALEDAEVAFGALELDAFRTASDQAARDVGCLTQTLPRSVIARLHRVEGLLAFVDDDPVGAGAAFASARAIAPSYQFPDALVPAGHPVHEQYGLQDPLSGGEAPIPAPLDGHIEVDGRVGAALPRTRPSVVQWARADGSVPSSAYLLPGDGVFQYPLADENIPDPPVVGSTGTPKVEAQRAHTSVPLAIGAGALLAVAGGAYALSANTRSTYLATDIVGDLDPLRARTNTLFYSSVGAGSAGVALGVSAVLVGKW